jgi:hypothetical protein
MRYMRPFVHDDDEDFVMGEANVQERQDMPDDPEYPGEGPTYDTMTPGNNVTIRETCKRKNMFYIKDKYMNPALRNLFIFLFSQEIQQTFGEELMANPYMKFKDMCQNFWDTYGRVTKEEVNNNKDRLTAVSQPHQRFEALVAHIETCLVYGYFTEKVISDKDLIDMFLIVITLTGYY